MERFILKNQDSFDLKDIFECGQCFRWNKQDDNSYIGVIKEAVIHVKQEENLIIFDGEKISKRSFEEIIKEYFDLDTDYKEYKKTLSKVDENLKKSIEFGSGIRILKQDLWECIISFIISANNNIPRIKKIIEKISEKYGKEIDFEGKKYYLFPTVEELSKATVQDFRDLGAGFRDIRLFKTTNLILNNEVDLEKLKLIDNTEVLRNELLKLEGVGPKVADCVLLFGLKREDVFPIDVWVRRVMNDLYIHNENEDKVTNKEIMKIVDEKFGNISAIAQQYLFYWRREA